MGRRLACRRGAVLSDRRRRRESFERLRCCLGASGIAHALQGPIGDHPPVSRHRKLDRGRRVATRVAAKRASATFEEKRLFRALELAIAELYAILLGEPNVPLSGRRKRARTQRLGILMDRGFSSDLVGQVHGKIERERVHAADPPVGARTSGKVISLKRSGVARVRVTAPVECPDAARSKDDEH